MLVSSKGNIAIASTASSEAGFQAKSAPKDGSSGMLKTGSEPLAPDPVRGMGTGGKGVRGVGSHIRDQLRGNIPEIA